MIETRATVNSPQLDQLPAPPIYIYYIKLGEITFKE